MSYSLALSPLPPPASSFPLSRHCWSDSLCMLVVVMRAVFQQPHSPDICDALCDLLVSLSSSHMHAIQDTLLDMFEPGCPPHTTVFAALESLCNSVPLLVPSSTLQRARTAHIPHGIHSHSVFQCVNTNSQVLNCITPLFSVLTDAAIKRLCLQLFGAIACAGRAKTAWDGKARVCVEIINALLRQLRAYS